VYTCHDYYTSSFSKTTKSKWEFAATTKKETNRLEKLEAFRLPTQEKLVLKHVTNERMHERTSMHTITNAQANIPNHPPPTHPPTNHPPTQPPQINYSVVATKFPGFMLPLSVFKCRPGCGWFFMFTLQYWTGGLFASKQNRPDWLVATIPYHVVKEQKPIVHHRPLK
jgi:hypothetical protein